MHRHHRLTMPVALQRLADIARLQGAPPTFFQIVGTGAWFQDSVKAMRRAETDAVDRAQGLLGGEENVVFHLRRLSSAKLMKLLENGRYWPAMFGYGVLRPRVRA